MTVAYLVRGHLGKYDDYESWIAAGYSNHDRAYGARDIMQEIANKAHKKLKGQYEKFPIGGNGWLAIQESSLDPNMKIDYFYETIYQVEEINWNG